MKCHPFPFFRGKKIKEENKKRKEFEDGSKNEEIKRYLFVVVVERVHQKQGQKKKRKRSKKNCKKKGGRNETMRFFVNRIFQFVDFFNGAFQFIKWTLTRVNEGKKDEKEWTRCFLKEKNKKKSKAKKKNIEYQRCFFQVASKTLFLKVIWKAGPKALAHVRWSHNVDRRSGKKKINLFSQRGEVLVVTEGELDITLLRALVVAVVLATLTPVVVLLSGSTDVKDLVDRDTLVAVGLGGLLSLLLSVKRDELGRLTRLGESLQVLVLTGINLTDIGLDELGQLFVLLLLSLDEGIIINFLLRKKKKWKVSKKKKKKLERLYIQRKKEEKGNIIMRGRKKREKTKREGGEITHEKKRERSKKDQEKKR